MWLMWLSNISKLPDMFFVAENVYADVKLEIRKTRNNLVKYEFNATSNSAA